MKGNRIFFNALHRIGTQGLFQAAVWFTWWEAGSRLLLSSQTPCDLLGQQCLSTGEHLAQRELLKLASGQTHFLLSSCGLLSWCSSRALSWLIMLYIYIYKFGIKDPSSHSKSAFPAWPWICECSCCSHMQRREEAFHSPALPTLREEDGDFQNEW